MFLAKLSGEKIDLGLGELKAVLELSESRIVEVADKLVVFDVRDKEILKRLALTKEICEYWGKCKKTQVLKFFREVDLPIKPPYCVRSDDYKLQLKIADEVWRKLKKPSVDLENPKTLIKVFIIDDRAFIGRHLFYITQKQFASREPEKRPFKKPICMKARLSRALVNLTRVRKGESILDPMCGTGGFLIEAGMIGAKLFGSDLDKRMVEGTKENLKKYGLYATIRKMDSRKLTWNRRFDAVIVDLPYGRSTKLFNEDLERLYTKTLKNLRKVLKKGRVAVVVIPKRYFHIVRKAGFKILEKYEEKVHANLRRLFLVLQ